MERYRILILGSGGVGKTCCVLQFVDNVFVGEYDPSFYSGFRKFINIDDVSTDLDIEEFFDFDPHVDFLLLDDVVPEDFDNHKINLKEDDDEGLLASGIEGTTPSQSLTRTRLSLGGLSVTRAEQRSSFGVSSSSQQRMRRKNMNMANMNTWIQWIFFE